MNKSSEKKRTFYKKAFSTVAVLLCVAVCFGADPYGPRHARRLELPRIESHRWFVEYPKGAFAMEYDTMYKQPKWVAWSMHTGFNGSVERTDAWHFDTRLDPYNVKYGTKKGKANDFRNQPDLRDTSCRITYDRGHLCPSNDRKATNEMNAQTFVYSNMSPQLPGFNQGIWARLESCVNKWGSIEGDTLYICAGGVLADPKDIGTFTVPSRAAVPKHYFKVVLCKKKDGSFRSIGFWFEHRDYGKKENDLKANLTLVVRSVDEIETLTGLNFFYPLPASIERKVETQKNIDDWDF